MTTTLNRSPPNPSFCLDGVVLGTGIDAITGEVAKSGLNPDFQVQDVPSKGDTTVFRFMEDATELEHNIALGFSSSITFPADGVKVGAKNTLDFTSSNQSSVSTVLILFDWERKGQAKAVSGPKLSADASKDLNDNKATFRTKYGDYFVHQISYQLKFTAVWRCVAEKSSQIKEFKKEMSGSLSAGEMEASGSFTTKLSSSAKKTGVIVEVQYQVIGDAGNTQYEFDDISKTFTSFRSAAKAVPHEMLLRHYNIVDTNAPVTINMPPDVFTSICNVFTSARFVLFLIGVVPGTRSVRIQRRNQINTIYTEIFAKRIQFGSNPSSLKDALDKLQNMHDMLWLRLQRQDLVVEMASISYDDFKKKFAVDHENVRGAWVRSSQNVSSYVLGRVGFDASEIKKYAVSQAAAAEVRLDGQIFQQLVDALEFPGTTGLNGYVVGLTVESRWKDGTNGWWCIGTDLKLGTKQAKVEVKSEGSRGMHWSLKAHYIPAKEYDE